jgi:hypothetical protein
LLVEEAASAMKDRTNPKGRGRVRVIADPEKYRRHRWKKQRLLLLRVIGWSLGLLVGTALFWFLLGKLTRPPALE